MEFLFPRHASDISAGAPAPMQNNEASAGGGGSLSRCSRSEPQLERRVEPALSAVSTAFDNSVLFASPSFGKRVTATVAFGAAGVDPAPPGSDVSLAMIPYAASVASSVRSRWRDHYHEQEGGACGAGSPALQKLQKEAQSAVPAGVKMPAADANAYRLSRLERLIAAQEQARAAPLARAGRRGNGTKTEVSACAPQSEQQRCYKDWSRELARQAALST